MQVPLGMAFIPDFPAPVFALLAAMGAASVSGPGPLRSLLRIRRPEASGGEAAPPQGEAEHHAFTATALPPALHGTIAAARLADRLGQARGQVGRELGIACPAAAVRLDLRLPGSRCAVATADLRPNRLLLRDDPVHLEFLGFEGEGARACSRAAPRCGSMPGARRGSRRPASATATRRRHGGQVPPLPGVSGGRRVRCLLLKDGLAVPVLSCQELAPDSPVQPIRPIGLGLPADAPRTDAVAA